MGKKITQFNWDDESLFWQNCLLLMEQENEEKRRLRNSGLKSNTYWTTIKEFFQPLIEFNPTFWEYHIRKVSFYGLIALVCNTLILIGILVIIRVSEVKLLGLLNSCLFLTLVNSVVCFVPLAVIKFMEPTQIVRMFGITPVELWQSVGCFLIIIDWLNLMTCLILRDRKETQLSTYADTNQRYFVGGMGMLRVLYQGYDVAFFSNLPFPQPFSLIYALVKSAYGMWIAYSLVPLNTRPAFASIERAVVFVINIMVALDVASVYGNLMAQESAKRLYQIQQRLKKTEDDNATFVQWIVTDLKSAFQYLVLPLQRFGEEMQKSHQFKLSVSKILRHAHTINLLTNDLLLLTKISEGRYKPNNHELVFLHEMTSSLLRSSAKNLGIARDFVTIQTGIEIVSGDKHCVTILVSNLIYCASLVAARFEVGLISAKPVEMPLGSNGGKMAASGIALNNLPNLSSTQFTTHETVGKSTPSTSPQISRNLSSPNTNGLTTRAMLASRNALLVDVISKKPRAPESSQASTQRGDESSLPTNNASSSATVGLGQFVAPNATMEPIVQSYIPASSPSGRPPGLFRQLSSIGSRKSNEHVVLKFGLSVDPKKDVQTDGSVSCILEISLNFDHLEQFSRHYEQAVAAGEVPFTPMEANSLAYLSCRSIASANGGSLIVQPGRIAFRIRVLWNQSNERTAFSTDVANGRRRLLSVPRGFADQHVNNRSTISSISASGFHNNDNLGLDDFRADDRSGYSNISSRLLSDAAAHRHGASAPRTENYVVSEAGTGDSTDPVSFLSSIHIFLIAHESELAFMMTDVLHNIGISNIKVVHHNPNSESVDSSLLKDVNVVVTCYPKLCGAVKSISNLPVVLFHGGIEYLSSEQLSQADIIIPIPCYAIDANRLLLWMEAQSLLTFRRKFYFREDSHRSINFVGDITITELSPPFQRTPPIESPFYSTEEGNSGIKSYYYRFSEGSNFGMTKFAVREVEENFFVWFFLVPADSNVRLIGIITQFAMIGIFTFCERFAIEQDRNLDALRYFLASVMVTLFAVGRTLHTHVFDGSFITIKKLLIVVLWIWIVIAIFGRVLLLFTVHGKFVEELPRGPYTIAEVLGVQFGELKGNVVILRILLTIVLGAYSSVLTIPWPFPIIIMLGYLALQAISVSVLLRATGGIKAIAPVTVSLSVLCGIYCIAVFFQQRTARREYQQWRIQLQAGQFLESSVARCVFECKIAMEAILSEHELLAEEMRHEVVVNHSFRLDPAFVQNVLLFQKGRALVEFLSLITNYAKTLPISVPHSPRSVSTSSGSSSNTLPSVLISRASSRPQLETILESMDEYVFIRYELLRIVSSILSCENDDVEVFADIHERLNCIRIDRKVFHLLVSNAIIQSLKNIHERRRIFPDQDSTVTEIVILIEPFDNQMAYSFSDARQLRVSILDTGLFSRSYHTGFSSKICQQVARNGNIHGLELSSNALRSDYYSCKTVFTVPYGLNARTQFAMEVAGNLNRDGLQLIPNGHKRLEVQANQELLKKFSTESTGTEDDSTSIPSHTQSLGTGRSQEPREFLNTGQTGVKQAATGKTIVVFGEKRYIGGFSKSSSVVTNLELNGWTCLLVHDRDRLFRRLSKGDVDCLLVFEFTARKLQLAAASSVISARDWRDRDIRQRFITANSSTNRRSGPNKCSDQSDESSQILIETRKDLFAGLRVVGFHQTVVCMLDVAQESLPLAELDSLRLYHIVWSWPVRDLDYRELSVRCQARALEVLLPLQGPLNDDALE